MKDLIESIKYGLNVGKIDEESYYLLRDRLNFLQEEISFNGEIVNKLNDYYLPYYQNFDRFDD